MSESAASTSGMAGVRASRALYQAAIISLDSTHSGAVTALSQALGMAIAAQAVAHGASGPDDPRVNDTLEVCASATRETVRILLTPKAEGAADA